MKDDTISRAAAIDALDEQIRQCDKALSAFDISMKDEYAVKVERASLVAFRETLEYMPPAQSGWIPCSESPMKNNSYLVWMPFAPEGHHITVAEWCGSYWNIKTPITAWMPLPKAWEGGQDEAEQ